MARKLKHRSAYSNRSYFRASDFPEPKLMVIEEIRPEKLESTKNEDGTLVAYFVGEHMGIALNQENQDTLEAMSGSGYPDDWIGLEVEVFCKHGVRNPNGGTTDGIRLRRPAQPAPRRLVQPTESSFDEDEMNRQLAEATATGNGDAEH